MSNLKETPSETNAHLYPAQGGGREAIQRIMEAYEFSTRQALCNHLGISQSTMANRWMRDTFPHDWLIACHLDTGTSMLWLATGQGDLVKDNKAPHETQLRIKKITGGILLEGDLLAYDTRLLSDSVSEPFLLDGEGAIYLIEGAKGEVTDGLWLIDIDGLVSLKEIYRLPGRKLRVENGPASFDCTPDDINVLGKVISKTEQI